MGCCGSCGGENHQQESESVESQTDNKVENKEEKNTFSEKQD